MQSFTRKRHPTIIGDIPSVGTWNIPLTRIETADYGNMLTESADKMWICQLEKSADRICWQKTNLLTRKICWQNLLTKIESADDQASSKNFASRQPGHGWLAHSFCQIQHLSMSSDRTFQTKTSFWRASHVRLFRKKLGSSHLEFGYDVSIVLHTCCLTRTQSNLLQFFPEIPLETWQLGYKFGKKFCERTAHINQNRSVESRLNGLCVMRTWDFEIWMLCTSMNSENGHRYWSACRSKRWAT